MKKNVLLICSLIVSSLAYSQIGINTPNPQGILHIDGAKDNPETGTPTAVQQTNDFAILNNGNVGIGITAPNAPLQFGTTVSNRKIVLWQSLNNDHQFYGFGVNGGSLRYQTDTPSSAHVFYAATGATTSNELMRIRGNGNVGIGTSAPTAKLDVAGNIKIADGTQGANKILTSDADGLASWQDPAASQNIYNTNGTLAGNRTVTQGTNTLAFTGTASNAFSVDGATFSVNASNDRVGIGTTTPAAKLDVAGTIRIADGTQGVDKVLTSNATGVASWKSVSSVKGSLAAQYYIQGTSALNVNQGTTAQVPGVALTVTVPAGMTQTFFFNILGYANAAVVGAGVATQGVFGLYQNGTKISSAYTSSGDGGGLVNLPAPVTFLKSVSLSAGTYTFTVRYSAWHGNQRVNHLPNNYIGYNGDSEAMLTKMQVMIFNN